MPAFDLRRARRTSPRAALVIAAATLGLAACRTGATAESGPARGLARGISRGTAPDTAAIRRDITHLASDALEGRGTGTAGNDSAAAYIARRFADLGWATVMRDTSRCRHVVDGAVLGAVTGEAPRSDRRAAAGARCGDTFLQRFNARSVVAAHAGMPSDLPTQNVVALLRGSDERLRDEYVVIGAHFDHLGRLAFGALDPDAKDAIRNGADDNASGTAAVVELARLLSLRPPRRSVLFVAFSGEEIGLLGSQHFVEHLPVPRDRVGAMLNFDMVGRLRDGKVIVYGTGTAAEMGAVLDSANAATPLDLRRVPDGYGPSDHSSFYGAGIPVLHFFTDVHEDYHRASDDAEKIDAGGVGRVVALAERVARAIADRPDRLTAIRVPRPQPAAGAPTRGARPYLGSVPDMGAVDTRGVRLTSIGPGSPAEQAGLKTGDVIVEFDGKPVTNLQDYSDALYARQPGDRVTIVVLRGGARVTVTATLTRRGS